MATPPLSPARPQQPARSARGLGGAGGLRLVPASPAAAPAPTRLTDVGRESTVADEKETVGILASLAQQAGVVGTPATSDAPDLEDGEKSWMVRLQESVTPAPVAEATSNLSWCCASMTLQDRLVGFGICFVLGNACSASSYRHLVHWKPNTFALTYTLGNIIALCSTFFLWGPKAQIRGMTDPKRIVLAMGYLGTIALTLISAVLLQKTPITLACMVVQFVVGTYYSLSYIPGAQYACSKLGAWCCGGVRTCSCCSDSDTDRGAI
jgi:hypothetical protein